jgi:prefoldin subunit 5
MAERQRRLEELAGQIKAIDVELGELRRQAMESGLDVSKLHMPGAL